MDKELHTLLEKAERQLRANPEADQVIVLKTAKENLYCFANHGIMNGDTADEGRFVQMLRDTDDTEVRCLVAVWKNGCVDLPSMHFRCALLELDPRNGEAAVLLRSENGYTMRTVGSAMP